MKLITVVTVSSSLPGCSITLAVELLASICLQGTLTAVSEWAVRATLRPPRDPCKTLYLCKHALV